MENSSQNKRSLLEINASQGIASESKRQKEFDCDTTITMDIEHEKETNPPVVQVNPTSILSDTSCKVQTLTVSDQHATLLLTYDDVKKAAANNTEDTETSAAKPVIRSLLKLTLVPFHRALLGSNPAYSPSDTQKPELKLLDHNQDASEKISTFLKDHNYKLLKSDSGAEYSYYKAAPLSKLFKLSDIRTSVATEKSDEEPKGDLIPCPSNNYGAFDVELISPATERQISRAMPSLGSTLIYETPEIYQKVVQPFIKTIVDGNSLGWVNNIIEVKKEKERLIVNSSQFIINIDTKWRSHPPPLSTPKKEWFGHQSVEDLYCLGIVKVKGIATLRDLRGEHISMLKNLQKEGLKAIENIYGVASDQIRIFVHYQPQFYHFHVHFTRLENEIGSTVERGHLLVDIIQNLEMDSSFYEKRTIAYKLKKLTPLHCLIDSYLNDVEENGDKS